MYSKNPKHVVCFSCNQTVRIKVVWETLRHQYDIFKMQSSFKIFKLHKFCMTIKWILKILNMKIKNVKSPQVSTLFLADQKLALKPLCYTLI